MIPLLYKISRGFARKEHLPIHFVGVALAEAPKALYLYGMGTDEKIQVDCWIPKVVIIQQLKSTEQIEVPKNHPKLTKVGFPEPSPRRATLTTYQKSGEECIKIEFPFNHEDLDRIRSLSNRKFHAEPKLWTARVCIENIEKLDEWGFEMDEKFKEFLKKSKVHISQVSEIEVPGLKKTLYPFQKKGVAFIEAKDGRALIGDEMGLGKTAQALAWLQLHPEIRPVVIVVPASLKLNWAKEITMWMSSPGLVQILNGTTPSKLIGNIIIINYDILPNWIGALLHIKPKVLIIDEVHYVKNNGAKRTKAIKKLGKGIPHVIALSGTPIVNRPVEIYNAVKLIDSSVLPSFWEYGQKYCGAKHNGFGWDFSGATNTEELHEVLTHTLMIRRKKVDVLPDLPEKVRAFIPMELDNQSLYNKAEDDFISFVKDRKGKAAAERASNAQALAEIEGLKQLAVQGKLKQCIIWIQDFLALDEKLVIFAVHKFVIDALMKAFPEVSVKVDGSVTGLGRQKAVDEFQSNPNMRLFIGNVKAAGVGITLTAASNVAFLELPWTPGEVSQAEDRTHRIGQKDSVTIHYLLAAGTIEEKVAKLIDKKRKVLDAVLDGKKTEGASLLFELMKEYE